MVSGASALKLHIFRQQIESLGSKEALEYPQSYQILAQNSLYEALQIL